jgi:hypothetical protein
VELTATVAGAMLPGGQPPGQDRWHATASAVVVLDGASAHDPEAPPADTYVTELCTALAEALAAGSDTRSALRGSIAKVAHRLGVVEGKGPSSTVLLLRAVDARIELAALGDSTAILGLRDGRIERVTDNRIAQIALDLRDQYRQRLRAGHGFDATHRALLREIQHAERAARNRPGGYWIAETDPTVAEHAIIRHYPASLVEWCVLATDGAQRLYDHRGGDWSTLPADPSHLRHRVEQLHRWESEHDPDGRLLPRAKRHDDKTLVVWRR